VTRLDIINNRLVSNPMEPRAAIGEYDRGTGDYTAIEKRAVIYTPARPAHLGRFDQVSRTLQSYRKLVNDCGRRAGFAVHQDDPNRLSQAWRGESRYYRKHQRYDQNPPPHGASFIVHLGRAAAWSSSPSLATAC
jgi:hypothetical protein